MNFTPYWHVPFSCFLQNEKIKKAIVCNFSFRLDSEQMFPDVNFSRQQKGWTISCVVSRVSCHLTDIEWEIVESTHLHLTWTIQGITLLNLWMDTFTFILHALEWTNWITTSQHVTQRDVSPTSYNDSVDADLIRRRRRAYTGASRISGITWLVLLYSAYLKGLLNKLMGLIIAGVYMQLNSMELSAARSSLALPNVLKDQKNTPLSYSAEVDWRMFIPMQFQSYIRNWWMGIAILKSKNHILQRK